MRKSISLLPIVKIIYVASFFFALQIATASYINSTFLATLIPESIVGIAFTVGALLTLIGLTFIPKIISAYGNKHTLLALLVLSFIALLCMTRFGNPILQLVGFILYLITNNIIVFTFDIFVQHFSDAKRTGSIRGFYLTIINTAWVLSPIIGGFLLSRGGYSLLYGISMMFVLIVFYTVLTQVKNYHDAPYVRAPFFSTLKLLWSEHELRSITILNFVLQFFYAWMIIYTPLYLHEHIGFTWAQIGIIFTIMLLPFILLELPLGRRSDTHGEKATLIFGLIVMGVATLFLPSLPKNIILWALFLFLTRVGAATAEVMIEVHFFKKITDSDSNFMSVFRDMSPLAFIIAPIFGTIIIGILPFKMLYVILGIFVLTGIFYALRLKDTKTNQ